MTPRKTWVWRETVHRDGLEPAVRPVTRVAVAIAISNPFAGRRATDLSELIVLGPRLAERYLPEAIALLPLAPIAYGKAAIVGIHGEIEHAAAVLHPQLGKPMRALIGGGAALIPSTAKVASMGTRIDIPLGHKDDAWSFDELDTLTLGFDDAPRADEIVVILALSDGGRPSPRIAAGRTAV
jgi:hypothetical protein